MELGALVLEADVAVPEAPRCGADLVCEGTLREGLLEVLGRWDILLEFDRLMDMAHFSQFRICESTLSAASSLKFKAPTVRMKKLLQNPKLFMPGM